MYRLENNVEWTEELKNAFKHNVTRAKIIYNDSNETILINENTGIQEITLEDNRYVPEMGFIGQATAKKVTLKLLNNQQTINLENKEFTLYIGADYNNNTYYINYGNFIVNETPENDSTNGTVKVVAYDYMIKFNKNYVNSINYPCTLKNYLINICEQAGVELGSASFTNDDFLVENSQFEGKTLREVLQHIGKSAFSWVRIGQDNKLYIDFKANDGNATIEDITIDEYKKDAYKKANEYYGPINKVTYGDSDIQGQEESVEDAEAILQNGKKEIIINDNYFAYTTTKREELIQKGTTLFGLEYMPITQLDLIGFIYLDCTDFIRVFDEENNYVLSRVFCHTIKYTGIVTDSIESEGSNQTKDTYKNKNTTIESNSRTEIIVDRANKRVQSIASEVTKQNNKISTLTQTVDELSSKISDVVDVTVVAESNYGIVSMENINASEPITIKIHPISYSISYLYPQEYLFPSDVTYIRPRTLKFTNTTNNTFIEYELPANLLYYDSENYDEFYLNYDSGTCQVIKRCGYNADGSIYVLEEEIIQNYDYPSIELEDGNYTVSLVGYDNAYLFVRLMAANIYTTQYATKVELSSAIEQTVQDIDLSVNEKLYGYSTTTEMNSAINISKNSILSRVDSNYVTKIDNANTINTLSSRIKQTASSIELVTSDNNTSAGITIKLKNEDGTQIDSGSANITLSGLVKFTDLSTRGSTTINGSNITTGTINADLITTGTLSANRLNGGTISGSSINLGNGKFSVTSGGSLTATNANISGNITATRGTFDNCTIRNTCSVPASTVSGTLSTSTIPNISAGKITSGTMTAARISGGTLSGVEIDVQTVQGQYIKAHRVSGSRGVYFGRLSWTRF